ncbi:pre-mRNA-processing factor [Trifolium pratense]|uniref:Pre-mRNA-processing factor n=1 Tax=Trifolium pratense TaxID=57577 RepID=A0A2K3P666_TRIPR|nr:pre-mRNA-processing factor [Trifolium pratense]
MAAWPCMASPTSGNTVKNVPAHSLAEVLHDSYMDLSQQVFDAILVEREGFAFNLGIVYEHLSAFCYHCNVIGHDISACKWIHSQQKEVNVKTAKPEVINRIVKKEYVAKATA